jgi:thiol-disulfide isomerase/thioredoxin
MSKRGRKAASGAKDFAESVSEKSGSKGSEASSKAGRAISNRKIIYAVIAVAVAALIAWRLGTFELPGSNANQTGIVGDIGGQAAGVKVVSFLQSRLNATYAGIETEFVSVDYSKKIPGTYEVIVKITYQGQSQDVPYYVTKDGNYMFASAVDLNEPMPEPEPTTPDDQQGGILANQPENPKIETFSDSGAEICKKGGKPVVWLFSTTWCPHCKWINSTYENVVNEYVKAGKIVAHHWEVDTNDDTLTAEKETALPAEDDAIYKKFNPGGTIPTFVFGCKYYRVGTGYERENNLTAEEAEFRAVIEDLLSA